MVHKALRVCVAFLVLGQGAVFPCQPPESKEKVAATEAATEAEPQPVTKVFALRRADIDSNLRKRLQKLLAIYGRVSVDEKQNLVIVQCSPQHVGQVETLVTEFDRGSASGYLIRLTWLQDGIETGRDPPKDIATVLEGLKGLELGELRQVGQLLLRASDGTDFNTTAFPRLDREPATLSISGRVIRRTADQVVVRLGLSASVEAERQTRGRSSNSTVVNLKTVAKLTIGKPAVVSLTAYESGSALLIVEVNAAP